MEPSKSEQLTIPAKYFSEQVWNGIKQLDPAKLADWITDSYRDEKAEEQRSLIPAPVPVSSVAKGQLGEMQVEEILRKKFQVTNVSGKARSGDLQITHKFPEIPEIRVLVEVKNYSRSVPRAELDKFYRDLEIDRFHAAMFISLNTKIAGEELLPLEIKTHRQADRQIFIAYVVTNDPEIITGAAALLIAQARANIHATESIGALQNASYTKLYNLSQKAYSAVVSMAQVRQQLMNLRDQQHRAMTTISDQMASNEQILHMQLTKLMHRLHSDQPNEIRSIVSTSTLKLEEMHKLNELWETKIGYKIQNHLPYVREILARVCKYHSASSVTYRDHGAIVEFGDSQVWLRIRLLKTKTEFSWPGREVEMEGQRGVFVPPECEISNGWVIWSISNSTNGYSRVLKYWD